MKVLFPAGIALIAMVACTPQQPPQPPSPQGTLTQQWAGGGTGPDCGGRLSRQYHNRVRRDLQGFIQPQHQCRWHRT